MVETVLYGPCSETQRKFLQHEAFFVIYGGGAGSGKSHLAQMYALNYLHDPNFRAVYIRASTTQHRQAGGLWDTAVQMYSNFGCKFRHDNMTVVAPSGAMIQHKTCAADRDLKNFDGGQYSLVCWDEAQWHTKNQISYLFSRIRSKAKGPHRCIATCNPHPDAALRPFVEWFLDQTTGIPIPERSGTTRYFAEYRGDFVFAGSVEEMKEQYGDMVNPQTYTFISANIYSNPVLMNRDPGYVLRLENLKRSERARLLEGSWYVREEASKYFKREYLTMVDFAPVESCTRVRSWDLSCTVPSEVNRDPDYSASVLMSRDKHGIYTIEDATRFRKSSGDVVKEIIQQALHDGIDDVNITIPQETGPGKAWTQYLVRELAEAGIPVRTMQISGHKSKINRFLPFASLAETGSVQMVRGSWNEWLLNEMEAFDGGRSGHDDGVDCLSDCTVYLARANTLPTFSLGNDAYTRPSPLN